MPAATRLSQLSRLSWVIVSIPFRSPVRRWPCHRPEHGRPRTPAREGGSGNRRGGAGAARPSRASHGPSIPVAGERGGRNFLSQRNKGTPGSPRHFVPRLAPANSPRNVSRTALPKPAAGTGEAGDTHHGPATRAGPQRVLFYVMWAKPKKEP